jgi:hypothetical protein
MKIYDSQNLAPQVKSAYKSTLLKCTPFLRFALPKTWYEYWNLPSFLGIIESESLDKDTIESAVIVKGLPNEYLDIGLKRVERPGFNLHSISRRFYESLGNDIISVTRGVITRSASLRLDRARFAWYTKLAIMFGINVILTTAQYVLLGQALSNDRILISSLVHTLYTVAFPLFPYIGNKLQELEFLSSHKNYHFLDVMLKSIFLGGLTFLENQFNQYLRNFSYGVPLEQRFTGPETEFQLCEYAPLTVEREGQFKKIKQLSVRTVTNEQIHMLKLASEIAATIVAKNLVSLVGWGLQKLGYIHDLRDPFYRPEEPRLVHGPIRRARVEVGPRRDAQPAAPVVVLRDAALPLPNDAGRQPNNPPTFPEVRHRIPVGRAPRVEQAAVPVEQAQPVMAREARAPDRINITGYDSPLIKLDGEGIPNNCIAIVNCAARDDRGRFVRSLISSGHVRRGAAIQSLGDGVYEIRPAGDDTRLLGRREEVSLDVFYERLQKIMPNGQAMEAQERLRSAGVERVNFINFTELARHTGRREIGVVAAAMAR